MPYKLNTVHLNSCPSLAIFHLLAKAKLYHVFLSFIKSTYTKTQGTGYFSHARTSFFGRPLLYIVDSTAHARIRLSDLSLRTFSLAEYHRTVQQEEAEEEWAPPPDLTLIRRRAKERLTNKRRQDSTRKTVRSLRTT